MKMSQFNCRFIFRQKSGNFPEISIDDQLRESGAQEPGIIEQSPICDRKKFFGANEKRAIDDF